ncbi:hypothetical protein Glove_177g147 [Diversispora epigaea]|uniref:Uncharacterized protein n=1 Tax=Diversispora epigaea TaxID=1348612 RepID=A0A397IUT3_9GLOM|nr:hypothetical protein Glove_177g147 [Diversispora epigaea]
MELDFSGNELTKFESLDLTFLSGHVVRTTLVIPREQKPMEEQDKIGIPPITSTTAERIISFSC